MMGLTILTSSEHHGYPRPVNLRLDCDTMGCGSGEIFSTGNYVSDSSQAKERGWLERNGEFGRQFLCPACSGKKVSHPDLFGDE